MAVRGPDDTGRRPQFSVMLMNCNRLNWDIEEIVQGLDAGRFSYEQLMCEMCISPEMKEIIDPIWNSLERYDKGVTALLMGVTLNLLDILGFGTCWGN